MKKSELENLEKIEQLLYKMLEENRKERDVSYSKSHQIGIEAWCSIRDLIEKSTQAHI